MAEENKDQKVEEAVEPKKEEKTETGEVSSDVPKTVEKTENGEVSKEETKPEVKKEPSGKFKDLIKQIEELSVLELSELVKELEDRFGVSAAAPVAVAANAGGDASGAGEVEEKAIYTVMLTESGDQKINVIKTVREVTELGLKDAKDLVDSAPKEVKKDVPKEEAEEIKKKLEAAGAKVELK